MIYKKSATNVFEKHPCLYTLMFGCVFAKVAQKLVVRNYLMIHSINNLRGPQTQNWKLFHVMGSFLWCYHHNI